eukprot:1420259-Pleurochrysis_carterae.AAC.1
MLVFRRSRAPSTKTTSIRGCRKLATQVLQHHRYSLPSERQAKGLSRAVLKGAEHAPQGNNH